MSKIDMFRQPLPVAGPWSGDATNGKMYLFYIYISAVKHYLVFVVRDNCVHWDSCTAIPYSSSFFKVVPATYATHPRGLICWTLGYMTFLDVLKYLSVLTKIQNDCSKPTNRFCRKRRSKRASADYVEKSRNFRRGRCQTTTSHLSLECFQHTRQPLHCVSGRFQKLFASLKMREIYAPLTLVVSVHLGAVGLCLTFENDPQWVQCVFLKLFKINVFFVCKVRCFRLKYRFGGLEVRLISDGWGVLVAFL